MIFPAISLSHCSTRQRHRSHILSTTSVIVRSGSSVITKLPRLVLNNLITRISNIVCDHPLFRTYLLYSGAFHAIKFVTYTLSRTQHISKYNSTYFRTTTPGLASTFSPAVCTGMSSSAQTLSRLTSSLSRTSDNNQLGLTDRGFCFTKLITYVRGLYLDPRKISSVRHSTHVHSVLRTPQAHRVITILGSGRQKLNLLFKPVTDTGPTHYIVYARLTTFLGQANTGPTWATRCRAGLREVISGYILVRGDLRVTLGCSVAS